MSDIVDTATRSRMMSGIRGRDTKPELVVRRYLHRAGFRYGLHVRSLPGRPDIVLTRHRAVIFVHGCFWHRHPGCRYAYSPKSREDFWRAKLDGNAQRDAVVADALRRLDWRVFIMWECELGESHLSELTENLRAGHAAAG
jgi:DNA mismatch endonuclease (patch repair protein)